MVVRTSTIHAQPKHVRMRKNKKDSCLIFGSIPTLYSKTRWRTYAHVLAQAQKEQQFCFACANVLMLVLCAASLSCACAHACIVRVHNTVMLKLALLLMS